MHRATRSTTSSPCGIFSAVRERLPAPRRLRCSGASCERAAEPYGRLSQMRWLTDGEKPSPKPLHHSVTLPVRSNECRTVTPLAS